MRGLRREFGAVVAVDSVDLDIPDGSFTVLLGPSGCGKTTTLNMIAGLEDVTAGEILFDGEAVQYLPPDKRDIAMVFQSYALYPNRSVRDNIAFPLVMRGVRRTDIRGRVEQVAGRLGLDELLDRRPRQLSGGQQQRVALARAIVREPKVFLLDEPLSNLDAKLRNDTRIQLKEIQRDVGGTFVLVTHDQVEAMSLADVLVVMNEGRVQQVGTPMEVYRRPANRFVAGFVGMPSMNFVEGTVEDGSFRAPGWTIPLPLCARQGEMVLGFRAEDASLEPCAGDDSGNGAVRIVEQLGSDTLVVVTMDHGDVIVRADPDVEYQPGHNVHVRLGPRWHLFGPGSPGPRAAGPESITPAART